MRALYLSVIRFMVSVQLFVLFIHYDTVHSYNKERKTTGPCLSSASGRRDRNLSFASWSLIRGGWCRSGNGNSWIIQRRIMGNHRKLIEAFAGPFSTYFCGKYIDKICPQPLSNYSVSFWTSNFRINFGKTRKPTIVIFVGLGGCAKPIWFIFGDTKHPK